MYFRHPPLFTYADDVHEAVHAVADLEEQVLALPLSRGAERGPDEPGDAGDEEQGTQDDGRYLHLLNHRQRDGLPLEGRRGVQISGRRRTQVLHLSKSTGTTISLRIPVYK